MTESTVPLPVIILCGKGGVGKTTLSLALALGHADRGRTVVVVTSHPLRELAVSVSLAGLKEQHPQAAANLFLIHIDPREVLNRLVERQIPSESLAKAVLSSRIYKSLIEVAPGLKELAFLSRLQELAAERSPEDATRKFDLLVWDAPATGHFLQTLRASKEFDTYLSGPFAALGKQLAQLISDPDRFALAPVTTLEEMAVEETIELCGTLAEEFHTRPRCVICNMTSPVLASSEAVLEGLGESWVRQGTDPAGVQFILDRQAIERSLFERLRAAVETEFQIVERRPLRETDLELLLDLAGGFHNLAGILQ